MLIIKWVDRITIQEVLDRKEKTSGKNLEINLRKKFSKLGNNAFNKFW